MPGGPDIAPGTGKELLRRTRDFAKESLAKSWWCVISTFAILAAVLAFAALAPWWPAGLAAAFLGGLLLVRAFVLYHDFMHNAILRTSRLAKGLFWLYGLVVLCPSRSWRYSHNYHHAHVGKPIRAGNGQPSMLLSDVGAFPLMTTDMWQRASAWQRLRYRVVRHPVVMLDAYVTVFLSGICLSSLLRNPRKHWDSALSILVHGGVIAAMWIYGGPLVALFAWLIPFAIASAAGAYLFFAQHNFAGMQVLTEETWTHHGAALASSSFMKLGPIMNWFTANIGFHHVHHLNSRIPFYALPQAMASIPEAQEPAVTTLRLRDVSACLRLNLWDPRRECLVGYRDAARGADRTS